MNSYTIISYRYFEILSKLRPEVQLEVMELLSKSLAATVVPEKRSISNLFGAWQGSESAEQMIDDIRTNRNTNRNIELL